MSNIRVIVGQFHLVYHQKMCKKDKKCFLEKIGATIIDESKGINLKVDLVMISPNRWPDLDLELDAEKISIHIELLSGHQITCIPNQSFFVNKLEDAGPIFYREKQKNIDNLAFPVDAPNDPYYPVQLNLQKARINEVWEKYKVLGTGIRIGVLDSGSDPGHPDLRTTFVRGYNFTNNSVTRDTLDDDGHGTFVSGIIGATTNNGKGIAAAAPGSEIVPFKVTDNGKGNFYTVLKALLFIAEESLTRELFNRRKVVDIVNISLSEDLDKALRTGKLVSLMQAVIDELESLGILVVAAAGNSGDAGNPEQFPASLHNVISVASIYPDPKGTKTPTSSYGDWVQVAAVGYDVISTSLGESMYQTNSGTSFAAPLVSGILALMLEYINLIGLVGIRNRAEYLRGILYGSAIVDDQTGKYWNYGRVDALRAIELIPIPPNNDFFCWLGREIPE